MLYHLSYSHFDGPFDVGQGGLCERDRNGEIDFSCVAIYPGLIHTAYAGENDMGYDPNNPNKDREKKKGQTSAPNLVSSVRANLRNMIEGKELEALWQGEEEIGDVEMWFDEGKSE